MLLDQHFSGCFGCGTATGGLELRFTTAPGLAMTTSIVLETRYQGAPGLAHGGVVASIFDEALGALQVYFDEPAVTARLETSYKRPVPLGVPLHVRTVVDDRAGRKLLTSGVATLGAPDGPVAATATALFIFVDPAHFTTHGRADEVAAAADELGRWINP